MNIDYSKLNFNAMTLIKKLTARFHNILRSPFVATTPTTNNSFPETVIVLYGYKTDGTIISLSLETDDMVKDDDQIFRDVVDFIIANNMDVLKTKDIENGQK